MFFETYETQKNTLWYARKTSLDGSRGVSCLLIGASVDQSSGVFHLAPERTCHMQLNALLRQTRISTSKNIYLNFKPLGEHTQSTHSHIRGLGTGTKRRRGHHPVPEHIWSSNSNYAGPNDGAHARVMLESRYICAANARRQPKKLPVRFCMAAWSSSSASKSYTENIGIRKFCT